MKISRRFTKVGQDAFSSVQYEKRTSRISNPDGTVVFEMTDAEIPSQWSQLATDIMVSKYFRKAGVPQLDAQGNPLRDAAGNVQTGPEKSVKQVVHRLAGCWRWWAEQHGYFDTPEDAQAFYDEIAYMLLHQMCAPNSPQWFNTGLNFAYGITGPSQGHFYCDPKTGQLLRAADAYSHPQPHACQPYAAPVSTPQGPIAIGRIVQEKMIGLEVYDGTADGAGVTKVVAVKANGRKLVYRVVLKNGTTVEATGDHLIWATQERRTSGQWLKVESLRPRMRMFLSTATQITKPSNDTSATEAALVGWLQGDGFVGQYTEGTNCSLTAEFMTVNDDEHAFVIERVQQIFGDIHYHIRDVESQSSELDIKRIRFYGEALRPFINKYNLLLRGEDLCVPQAIHDSGKEAQCTYLKALFQADGCVRLRSRASNTADVVLTTTSAGLAQGVQTLLLNLGIYARIQTGVEKRTSRRTPYFVSIGYGQSRQRFAQLIGFVSQQKQTALQCACAEPFGGKCLPSVREEAIARIELIGEHEVFDIQTESGQYLSNNVLVHNCFIQSVQDDLVNAGGIMDLWTREARLFKYGSGTGSNFSKLRGENESLSGGGKSSGLMSFLKIGDRAAGAIKSGGTTRRAAKMVCLDLDHPDIEQYINWKVREELKVAAMAEGIKHLDPAQRRLAQRLGVKLDYDFNGEAYQTVSGQNSNNSVRIPNRFFHELENDGDWELIFRGSGKVAKKIKSRDLWEQIAFAAWRCADPGVQFDDTINQWHTCPNSGRINASNPCVTGETRVLTRGGVWRRIDSMIHLPEAVQTNLHGRQVHPTEGAFPTGRKPVFQLRTRGGYTLRLTADHRLWTRRRGWVAAADLQLGVDEVCLPGELPADVRIAAPRDAHLFQLLGLYLSSANGGQSALRLDVCADGSQRFGDYLERHWDQPPLSAASFYNDDYVNVAMLESAATATVRNRRLLSRLQAFIKVENGQPRLGDDLFTADLAAQRLMLQMLFEVDGQAQRQVMQIRHNSQGLLEDVQTLLLGFGIQSARWQEDQAHVLRLAPHSMAAFERWFGSDLSAEPRPQTAEPPANWDTVASLNSDGVERVYDLTEPQTHSFIANGLCVHNCSEYMFLDDTACNLASLNVLTFFDAEHRTFDIEAYRHAARLWTIVLETSVLMASFPSEQIAKLSYRYRTLGLGYANLGAMLMQSGIAYDSPAARAICAALTSILTGESYATSAEMAGELGAFEGYESNRDDMLRVLRNHRRAAYDVRHHPDSRQKLGDYEQLEIAPVGIDAAEFKSGQSLAGPRLLQAARDCWDRALELGQKHGFRNAQVSVIAPTGTIGLLMDCDTTGVEPDFALVKFKKLSGGGYFKIANQSLPPALVSLGYAPQEIHDILRYVMGTLSFDSTPHINHDSLRAAGLTNQEIHKIEQSLPGVFELSFAFSGWSLGEEAMNRLHIAKSEWTEPGFNLLRRLGFKPSEITEANEVICGRGTVEGSPHLKAQHYPVFDCANRCGRHGQRFIEVQGHIRMMAAAQPFISGAISKTINLPNEATVEQIKRSYQLSWSLGLKANALYRDGSKLSQPLNVKSDEELDSTEEEDAEDVEAARQEVAKDVVQAMKLAGKEVQSDNLSAAPEQSRIIEKIVERVVERPLRRRLPDTRRALTHKFDVAGHEGYITVGLYEDGQPGEVFITMAKEGSTIGGLMDTVATLVSVSLQYGVPIESLVRKFEHVRFEPSGMTRNREIPIAKSLVDYIFRWLAMEFMPGYRAANSPQRPQVERTPDESGEASKGGAAAEIKPTGGNGHGPRGQTHSDLGLAPLAGKINFISGDGATLSKELRVGKIDPLSQQGSEMQADAPACDVCGSITVRSGTCYKCLNCGNSMGCS